MQSWNISCTRSQQKKRIELLEKQISVVMRRMEQSKTDDDCTRYSSAALQKSEDELDKLVLPH